MDAHVHPAKTVQGSNPCGPSTSNDLRSASLTSATLTRRIRPAAPIHLATGRLGSSTTKTPLERRYCPSRHRSLPCDRLPSKWSGRIQREDGAIDPPRGSAFRDRCRQPEPLVPTAAAFGYLEHAQRRLLGQPQTRPHHKVAEHRVPRRPTSSKTPTQQAIPGKATYANIAPTSVFDGSQPFDSVAPGTVHIRRGALLILRGCRPAQPASAGGGRRDVCGIGLDCR